MFVTGTISASTSCRRRTRATRCPSASCCTPRQSDNLAKRSCSLSTALAGNLKAYCNWPWPPVSSHCSFWTDLWSWLFSCTVYRSSKFGSHGLSRHFPLLRSTATFKFFFKFSCPFSFSVYFFGSMRQIKLTSARLWAHIKLPVASYDQRRWSYDLMALYKYVYYYCH